MNDFEIVLDFLERALCLPGCRSEFAAQLCSCGRKDALESLHAMGGEDDD